MSNEEQMKADFEAWWRIQPKDVTKPISHFQTWKAATASEQQEIDALTTQVRKYQDDFERSVREHESCKVHADALTQQVLELSAQVEVMREALRDSYDENASNLHLNIDALLTIEPSAALRAHVNEEVAKALEEIAFVDKARHYVVNDEDGNEFDNASDMLIRRAAERRNGK